MLKADEPAVKEENISVEKPHEISSGWEPETSKRMNRFPIQTRMPS